MKKFKIFFFIYLILLAQCILADATPKFIEKIQINIPSSKQLFFDSFYIIVNKTDTAYFKEHSTAEYWTKPTIDTNDNCYILTDHSRVTLFKIVAKIKDKTFISKELNHYPGNSLYNFEIIEVEANKNTFYLIDKSNYFHFEWSTYFKFLLITIISEVLLGTFIIFIFRRIKLFYVSIAILVLNLITHFTLWSIYTHFQIGLFWLEIVVIFTEGVFLTYYLKTKLYKSILLSTFLNTISWFLGLLYG